MCDPYTLSTQNLVPFYLIEDRLKQNFTHISSFITSQLLDNTNKQHQIDTLHQYNRKYSQQMVVRMAQMEKNIVREINAELEGRIVVAINKNMAGFAARMEDKEKEIEEATSGIHQRMDKMKKELAYEASKDSQKKITKEVEKVRKDFKRDMDEITRKMAAGRSNPQPVTATARPISRERPNSREKSPKGVLTSRPLPSDIPQNMFGEDWVVRIKQLEGKVAKFQEFAVNVDKRMYDNITSLKESWKQLGEEVLDTKKKLTVKQDEIKLELIKVRGMKEFAGSPDDYAPPFKRTLMDKFTDIYQMLSALVTRADFEGGVDKLKKVIKRHDQQLSDVREEMARNSDYFTFYANNSNQQDLSGKLKDLTVDVSKRDDKREEQLKVQLAKNKELGEQIEGLKRALGDAREETVKADNRIGELKENVLQQVDRIDVLEEHNNFTPQKMAKIHNTLDVEFTASEQELINHKAATEHQSIVTKQLKGQINKLKDQLFVLNHDMAEIDKLKKSYSGLENKVEKIRVESQEAIVSRKPWVCLSCDRNEKERQESERLKKDASRKKLVENRGGLFTNQKSEKMVKLIPAGEEKFEVYEKYKEKYMSDSVKLPDIYKEKIGEKEPNLT